MNLIKYIKTENILTGVKVSDKWELLRVMLDRFMENLPDHYLNGHTKENLWALIAEREHRQSTGLGHGVAFPHARIPNFNWIGMVVAVLDEPLEYDALDGQPIQLAFMAFNATEEPAVALKIWSTLADLLKQDGVMDTLLVAKDPYEVYRFFRERNLNLEFTLTARDIMTQPRMRIAPGDDLPQVAHNLMKHRENAAAVTTEDGTLLGEVTIDAIFKFGIPDFFSQLQSVSFIRNFNPLEKYFEQEHSSLAENIMTTECAVLPPSATLVEIIFLLSVKHHYKVYIVENGKLLGVIGRNAVLDRVVNF